MKAKTWLIRPMVVAVSSCFGAAPAWANPTGPQVMHGNVQMQGLGTSHLRVTNSPSSIIHWQGFSVGAGQVTQFQQQSAASAVLNRVVGPDISSIHGQLLSNGRVFLINPAGIIVGPGGVIDTAGFVGSTLNMLNADFLAGKLKFEGGPNAGSIVNQGMIKAGQSGNVILVAPSIQNSGVVQTEGGEIVLAAGQKVTIGSLKLEGVQFEIQAPSDSALNVGKLLAEDGAVGVFAGTLKHSGDIRASALARDEAGRVVLKAQKDTIVEGNATITADNPAGKGGTIQILGDRVSLRDRAGVSASGSAGGGTILVGGDYQGANAAVRNASRTFVGPNALMRADATESGDGGRVIVWADKSTQFYGSLSARGGVSGGNGGFAEVSGKENLIFAGRADLGAPKGSAGTLLLDPLDLFIDAIGGIITSIIDEATDVANNAVTVTPDALAGIAGNVNLYAGRYMLFRSPVNLTRAGQSLTATVAEWTPTDPAGVFDNALYVAAGADITTNGGAVSFTAPRITTGGGPAGPTITTNGGAISLTATRGAIDGNLNLNAGTGPVTAFAPKIPIPDTNPQQFDLFSVQLGNVSGGSLNISIAGEINIGNITTTGNSVSLTSAERSISTGNVSSGPGNVTFNAMSFVNSGNVSTAGAAVFATSIDSFVNTNDVSAGGGNVALMSRTGVFTNIIDTTGNVNLLATQGDIFATVNNAASLTASATRTDGNSVQTVINQSAMTPLNLNLVTATATGCFSAFFNCAGATVNVSAMGPVNVGTVTALAPVTGQNNTNALARIDSLRGSILAMSAASKVTGVNVSLTTGSPGDLAPEMGGSIGTAALPLNVDVRRTFTMRAGREFDVLFTGDRPNQLVIDVGVARTGEVFSGNLRHGDNVLLNANATDATVTLNSLPTTGFNQRVFNSQPLISFNVPNGNLNAPMITVPEGDTIPSSETYTTAGLNVTLSARNNVMLGSYTRTSSASSLPKQTSVTSEIGSVDIGTFNGNQDFVFISGPAGVTISATSLTTQGGVQVNSTTGALNIGKITSGGNVNLSSTSGNIDITEIDSPGVVSATTGTGNITVADIDTTTGAGGVTLRITCVDDNTCGVNPAIVGAAADNTTFEVRSGGSVSVTGHTIGTQGPVGMRFLNPLDLRSAANSFISLSSPNAGGRIGFALDGGDVPMVAETRDLRIIAGRLTGSGATTAGIGGSFAVSTGAENIQRLSVTANPAGLNTAGQASSVRSNASMFNFSGGSGAEVTINPGAELMAGTEFTAADALFSLTTHEGNITVTSDANLRNAAFTLNAQAGSIAAQRLDARAIALSAGTANRPGLGTNVSIVTGALNAIGGDPNTNDVTITSGRNFSSFFNTETPRAGRVQTGPIEALRDITITAFGEHPMPMTGGPAPAAIRIDSGGVTGDIGAATPARNVVLNAIFGNDDTSFSASGRIEVRDIRAENITLGSRNNTLTTRNLSGTSSINLHTRQQNITTGTLDSPTIHIRQGLNDNNLAGPITTGAVGATIPVRTLNLRSNASVNLGAVTLDTSVANTVDIHGNGGQTTLGGAALVGGAGSTINITSNGANPFMFNRINAGDTGTVNITSTAGIQQTADTAADGITARTISLATGTTDATNTRAIDNTGDAVFGLDLRNGTEPINLTVNSGGPVALNANNAVLSDLTITRTAAPDAQGFQPFTLSNLGAGATTQTVIIDNTPSNLTLEVNSPSALNLRFTHLGQSNRGIALDGVGIMTSGGNVFLDSRNGPLNASTGGIRTGGAMGGGNVELRTSGGAGGAHSITTGAIDTRPAMGNAGFIDARTNCAGCDINVSGNLDSGDATGHFPAAITLRVENSGSITGPGTITSASANTVQIFTNNGDIGSMATPLSIVTPTANLEARGGVGNGVGTVFANLTGTDNLTLRGDNGFNVSSTVGFDTLSVTTRATGLGTPGANTLNLTATGQTYAFARVDTTPPDPPDRFQVITAAGSGGAPPTNATFRAQDGDLLVAGGANLTSPNLSLFAQSGNVRLDGTASPLVLNNTAQTFGQTFTGQSLIITGNVTLNADTQQFFAGQNVDITGDATLTAVTQQQFQASQNITVQAQNGNVLIEAPNQSFFSSSGNISFLGGAGAGENVAVSANASQSFSTNAFSGGSLNLTAGAGNASSVSLLYTGGGTQSVSMRGSVNVTGGAAPSDLSFAEIRTTTGLQSIFAEGDVNVTAGLGTNADARIVNESANSQRIGETFCCSRQTDNITLTGGGAGSGAEITAAGPQDIRGFGTLRLRGGGAMNAPARVQSGGVQDIGRFGSRIGAIDMEGGGGTDSPVEILATGSQTVRVSNSTRLAGGTGTRSHALMRSSAATSQNISAADLMLLGGSAPDTFAHITTPGTQGIDFNSATLTGGSALNTFALVDTTAGTQTISGGDVMMTAGGRPPGMPVGNAGAGFKGRSQTVNVGAIEINGGAGLAGNVSDAGFENLAGDQSIVSSLITVNGGSQYSRAGILNFGTGTQFVSGTNGIMLFGAATGPQADVVISNPQATTQTIQATNGGVTLDNMGSGAVSIDSSGAQTLLASFFEVLTGSTGNSTISAVANQYLRTTDAAGPPNVASLRVAALGSGLASIDSGARQLLEVDYFEVATGNDRAGSILIGSTDAMGNPNAIGTSRIQAPDQFVFTRTLTVQGPASGMSSKLTGINTQAISVLDGVTNVFGGSGVNSVAAIDPTIQTIVANGALTVLGGGAAGATATVLSGGPQQIYVTKNAATVQGGSAAGTAASVQAAGDQTLAVAGALSVIGSATGANASGRVFTTAGTQTVSFGSLAVTANAGSAASITSPGAQSLSGGNVTMTSNTPNGSALIDAVGDQTFGAGDVMMNGGDNPNANTRITTAGMQALNFGALTMNAGNGGSVQIDSVGAQTLSAGNIVMNGGTAGSRITSAGTQTANFSALTMNAGNGGAVRIDSAGTQTLTGGNGDINLNASANAAAMIDGHSQTLVCNAACDLVMLGNSANAQIINLSGAQTITAGSIALLGGQTGSTTGIHNQGTGAQTIAASAGGIQLQSHANASNASVLIENVPATAQTITAAQDVTLFSRGSGTVAVTSGGTQSVDARGLDVRTDASSPGGANATVQAAGDQTVHTRGSLAAEAGVGLRVASRSTGTAKVEAAGNQTVNVDGNQLLIGRLLFGPPGPGDSSFGNPAVGDSLVIARSDVFTPSQTVTAASIYIQGPSGPFRVSQLKLNGGGTQTISVPVGYLTLIGGSAEDAFAGIDPFNQSITVFGNILLQGGSGPNADAIINATGPQSVISQNGSVTLIGGSGQGADALIATDSPFQTVSAANGVILTQGPAGGGIAGLQQGTNLAAIQSAATSSTSEILREQDELEELREDLASTSTQTGAEGEVAKVALCN